MPAQAPSGRLGHALQATAGKQVLVVEGEDDKRFFEALFDLRRPTWAVSHGVVAAEGRKRALSWTAAVDEDGSPGPFAQARCYVDRDVWTDAEVAQRQAAHGRLFVTDGWCIENLVVMLASQGHFGGSTMEQLAHIGWQEHDRDAWVRAGTFGWVWQRWQDELSALVARQSFAMPGDLDLSSDAALHAGLTARLGAAQQGPVDELVRRWAARLQQVLQLDGTEQWRQAVHGKKYMRAKLKLRLASLRPNGMDEHVWIAGVVNAHLDGSVSSLLTALGL
ncbi:MAG: hypothetical protein RL071_256 [Pseudomonadota bacterium]